MTIKRNNKSKFFFFLFICENLDTSHGNWNLHSFRSDF